MALANKRFFQGGYKMNSKELKQAIIDDIEFLKTAKIDIMDKVKYYSNLKKYCLRVFAWMYFPVVFLGLIFVNFSLYNQTGNSFSEKYLYSCVFIGFLVSLGFLFYFVTKIMNWIVFEELLLPNLKTQDMIRAYVKKFLKIYWQLYVVFLIFGMFMWNSLLTFFIEIFGLLIAELLVGLVIYAELNRIGASVLLEYLSNFFKKDIKKIITK